MLRIHFILLAQAQYYYLLLPRAELQQINDDDVNVMEVHKITPGTPDTRDTSFFKTLRLDTALRSTQKT